MAQDTPSSQCTVRLLAIAAQAAYRIKNDNLIDPTYSDGYQQTLVDMAEHGYSITDSIAPIKSKGTGTTPLAALCLTPQDRHSPLVIAFRGTKTSGDMVSDIKLGTTGVVEKKLRNAAFEYYQKIRKENPGREIVLTGHSLGGHLAQYVATKAYNTDPELAANPQVQVRTFNTAPVATRHSSIFSSHNHLRAQIVNYRLSPDWVSDLPLKQYYGNTFVFPCNKFWLFAHSMDPVMKYLPEAVLNQEVGTTDRTKTHNALVELVNGVRTSYQCRVKGQILHRFRSGAQNLSLMETELPKVLDCIKNKNYDEAIERLQGLEKKLDGKISKQIIDVLKQSTQVVKLNENKQEPEIAEKTSQVTFKEMKSQMQQLRGSEEGREDTESDDDHDHLTI